MLDILKAKGAGPEVIARASADIAMAFVRGATSASALYTEWDPAYPVLGKLNATHRGSPGFANADASYHVAPLHGDYSYTLSGNRGSAHVIDVIIHRNDMSTLDRPQVDSLGQQGIVPPARR